VACAAGDATRAAANWAAAQACLARLSGPAEPEVQAMHARAGQALRGLQAGGAVA
jgi:hypothetical protein